MGTDELPDMQDQGGKVRLNFVWETESHYEDEDEDEEIVTAILLFNFAWLGVLFLLALPPNV